MSARCWLAVTGERPADADAAAVLSDRHGAGVGWLAGWHGEHPPVPSARRADPRVLDPGGAQAWISLVLPGQDELALFDDGAVQGARRAVLADAEPADAITTLLIDDRHFAGALTVRRGPGACSRLAEDPFTRVHPGRVLHVGAGLLGTVAPPPGPCIERHGSATPWPSGTF